jgi:hypothetical protein
MNEKNKTSSQLQDVNANLTQLERTMVASIAMMKRLRRERKRFASIQNRSHEGEGAAAH